MKNTSGVLAVAVSALLAACSGISGGLPDPHSYHSPGHVTFGIWIEPHPLVDADEIMAGCAMWEPVGLTCIRTDREHAALQVVIGKGECKITDTPIPLQKLGETGIVDGRAVISLYPDCFVFDDDGNVAPGFLGEVSGHETGHSIGVQHVPYSCDFEGLNPPQNDLDGLPICGWPALMTPVITNIEYLSALTELDLRAFSVRWPSYLFPTGTERRGRYDGLGVLALPLDAPFHEDIVMQMR